jgi:hypothetical protein
LTGVLPKNQGNIIGFSILYLAANCWEANVNLSIDGLQVLKDVSGERFSRFWQRDPFVFLIPFLPGSTFNMTIPQPNVTGNIGRVFLTFYFDN